MAAHIVFLVHGMGDYKAGWSKDILKLLKAAYGEYKTLKQTAFDKRFEFVEIEYNAVFEERRKEWKKHADVVNKVLTANGLTDTAAKKLLDLASLPAGKDDFFKTHVLDVIMYRFMPQIADQVKRRVQEVILERTSKNKQSEPIVWSIVGHSLGTAVVHDTLQAMFTHKVNDSRLHHTRKPETVAMVSNVSRVLWNDASVYETMVRPHPDRTEGMCSLYLNFQHPLDPFPRIKPFHAPPKTWRNDENWSDYIHPKIHSDDITDWNVHDFSHYLLNPRVHVPLFRSLLWDRAIKKPEFDEQIKKYRKTRLKNSKTVQRNLEKYKLKDSAADDWEAITDAIAGFRSLVLGKGASE